MFPVKEVKTLRRTYEIGETCFTIVPDSHDRTKDRRVQCVVRFKFKPEAHTYESYVLEVMEVGSYPEMIVRDALRMQSHETVDMLFTDNKSFPNATKETK